MHEPNRNVFTGRGFLLQLWHRKENRGMNIAAIVGRLTRDPETRYTQGGTAVSRYTVAVDRIIKREGEPTADFIPCVAFGKAAEFADKYFRKGMRVAVSGRIQTGSYENKDGQRVYTTDVIVDRHEFAQNKGERETPEKDDGFYNVPEGIDDIEIPFNK